MNTSIFEQAFERGKAAVPFGNVATYIPELGKADKSSLGLCVYLDDGQKINIGDTTTRFTMQSISKIVSLAAALEVCGFDNVFEKIDDHRGATV